MVNNSGSSTTDGATPVGEAARHVPAEVAEVVEVANPAALALAERQRKADALAAEREAARAKEAAEAAMAAERERRMLAATQPQTIALSNGATVTMPALTMGAFLDLLPDLEEAMKLPDGAATFAGVANLSRHAYGFARCIERILGQPEGWSRTIGVGDYGHLFESFVKAAPLEAWHHFFDQMVGRIWALEPVTPPSSTSE